MALAKNPLPGGSSSGGTAPDPISPSGSPGHAPVGVGAGSEPGDPDHPGIGPGSGWVPGLGINLLAAIKTYLLVEEQTYLESTGQAAHQNGGGHHHPEPGPAPGAPGGTGPGTDAGACERPATPLRARAARRAAHIRSGPRVVRQGGQRRVFSDAKTLKENRDPVTHPPSAHAQLKARLKKQAKDAGISVLPGDGTLTLATRKIPGGKPEVVQYIRIAAADGDPHCQTWLHVWDDLTAWEQKNSTLDDVCAAAGISPVRLVKAVVGTAYESGVDVGNLVAAVAHPDTVAASAKFAKHIDGIEDRRLLFQHHGFVPTPKGTTINVGVSATASASAQAAANAGDSSIPSFLDDVEALLVPKESIQHQLIEAQTVVGPDLPFITTPEPEPEPVTVSSVDD